jgi:hypothetical protein
MMNHIKNNKLITTLISLTVIIMLMLSIMPSEIYALNDVVEKPKFPHVWRESDTALKVFWRENSDVSGYEIFKYNRNTKRYFRVKTVKDNQTRFWIDDNLKRTKIYRYKLRSFMGKGNNRKYSDFTYSVSATTYKNGDRRVNSSRINKFKRNIKIGIQEKKKPYAVITPSEFSNNKNKKPINKKVRVYVKSAKKISKLDNGYILGEHEGKSRVYIVAHNGNYRKINVNVINYSNVAHWDKLSNESTMWKEIMEKQEGYIEDIALFFLMNPDLRDTFLYLDDADNLVNKNNVDLGDMRDTIYRFLYDCPYEMKINVQNHNIKYDISYPDIDGGTIHETISFNFEKNVPETEDGMYLGYLKLADRWYYSYFVPT